MELRKRKINHDLDKKPDSLESHKRDTNKKVKNLKNDAKENQIGNNDWKIEDFLLDDEWKLLLKDEFEKSYFIELNKFLKPNFKKNIVRPPKELVFNAFNSTKPSQVCFPL